MTIEENMKIWGEVCTTDPKHTKPANIGKLSITAIAPQSQIMAATQQFGPYGKAWGFKSIELDYSQIERYDLVIFKSVFFYPGGEFPIINSSKMHIDNAKKMLDGDFAKKIETDTLTKALSKLGFNADVFMGCYDDVKYVEEMREKFSGPRELTDNDRAWIAVVKGNKEAAATIEDLEYRKFIVEQSGV